MNTSTQEENRATAATEAGKTEQKLKELVKKFRVCWEALPDCYPVKKEIRQVGYYLELTGTHEEGVDHPQPGCVHCQHVWRALEAIAAWIIPKEYRDTVYDIGPFDQTIQYSKERKYRPEVSLRIWIRHRVGFDREVDACEVRCLNEMTQRLVAIGAHKVRWDADDGEDLGGLFRSAALRRYGS